ncbi:hypothetical protein CGRA01v4_13552 [Colletotrichum graminicola]|nr:hypothetical protein CGRA01v4_13552 [Colletotrichum graminicola]
MGLCMWVVPSPSPSLSGYCIPSPLPSAFRRRIRHRTERRAHGTRCVALTDCSPTSRREHDPLGVCRLACLPTVLPGSAGVL